MVTIIPGSIGGIIVSITNLQLKIRTVSSDTTLLSDDFTVEVNASGGPVIITLPTAASQFDITTSSGRLYNIKKIDSSGNAVTITPSGADTIDGLPNIVISAQYVSYMLQSDGTRWIRL